MQCTIASYTPRLTLDFAKAIHEYIKEDKVLALDVVKKCGYHLWYLGNEKIALAFFDDKVSSESKENMCKKFAEFDQPDDDSYEARLQIPLDRLTSIAHWQLEDFITANTQLFFTRYDISTEFMKRHPREWKLDKEYTKAKKIVSKIMVVNDNAERGIKMIQKHHDKTTKDETQRQHLLQVDAKYGKSYPDVSKATLEKDFE